MRDVLPLRKSDRIAPPESSTTIINHTANSEPDLSNTQVHIAKRNEENASELYFLRAGHQAKILTRLKKAQFTELDADLDLHGLTAKQAETRLLKFLQRCLALQAQFVLIIHGKGLRSAGPPVVKDLTETMLIAHPSVIAFCSARPVDGGSGALYVQLS